MKKLRMSNSDFEGVTFEDLPRDIQVSVISFLDAASIYRFTATSKALRKLIDLPELWISRAKSIWPNEFALSKGDASTRQRCRRMLFTRARVRYDGAYVSRCVYTRRIQEGASLTDTRTCLQVVYHRIIRFLPDHTALMIISEKGAKGSARRVFDELAESDRDPPILAKFGKQLHRAHWKVIHEGKEGAMVRLSFFDGKLCWSGDLLVCSGTDRRLGGSRAEWYEYKFWDPTDVLDHRRRELYREREAVAARLRMANIDGTDIDTLSDLLYQYERLGDIMRSLRESHDDPVDSIPAPLLRQITLCEEHFPMARFVHSSTLAHLF